MAEASSSRAAPFVVPDTLEDKFEMRLWHACAETNVVNKLWYQEDLQSLEVMDQKDLGTLVQCINALVEQCLFRTMESRDGRQCWKLVELAKAANIRKLNEVERLIYFELETADKEGMWTKQLKQRTGLQVAEIQAACKKLESKGVVKQFASSKFPSKKQFILAHLQPSEDATGGLFYSDGGIDTELLNALMQMTEVFVHRKAWQAKESSTSDKNGKRKRDDYEDPLDPGIISGSKRWRGVKPMPANYQNYATVGEIAKYVNRANILKSDKIMEAEVEQVLNLLCYDGRLEKVGEAGFRTLLRPISNPYENLEEPPRNGFTEVPCGGCPAFELCDETGPVNARSCDYFKEWL